MKILLPQPPTQHSIKREPKEQKEQKEPQLQQAKQATAKSEPLVSAAAKDPLVVAASTASPASPPVVQSRKSSESKSSKNLTLFQILTKANIDWCRYCGTTEGVNWRPGPWGKRTLCNKHGCDFKGYGFACKLPRLDLTGYTHETVDQRIRPVLQHCKLITWQSLYLATGTHSPSSPKLPSFMFSLPWLPVTRFLCRQYNGPL